MHILENKETNYRCADTTYLPDDFMQLFNKDDLITLCNKYEIPFNTFYELNVILKSLKYNSPKDIVLKYLNDYNSSIENSVININNTNNLPFDDSLIKERIDQIHINVIEYRESLRNSSLNNITSTKESCKIAIEKTNIIVEYFSKVIEPF